MNKSENENKSENISDTSSIIKHNKKVAVTGFLADTSADERLFEKDLDGFSSPLLTIPEVADFLKVSVPTVRRLQQQRAMPFTKVGGSVRFLKEDLISYLQKQRVEIIE